tara:strand:+ start:266 stop:478 length:213 start_codon:yes stop_codon:yes gene_type:complete
MAKMKRYIMDIEEKVYDLDLEKIITEADNVNVAEEKVLNRLGFKNSFDIGIAKDTVRNCWNEYWGDYVTY